MNRFKAVVIGASAGGLNAISTLLSYLPETLAFPVIVVQHLHHEHGGNLVEYFCRRCSLSLHEPADKDTVRPGCVYFAPANYHLLVEKDETFSLSVDEKVHYSRPSIDVLFENAAHVWGKYLGGVILTGANNDGAYGLRVVKEYGGMTIVQDPATAEHSCMPQAAIDAGEVDCVISLEQIGKLLRGKEDNE